MYEFEIQYIVPYEGTNIVYVCSLDEVKKWLKENRSSYDYDLNNVRILESRPEIDVFDLMRES